MPGASTSGFDFTVVTDTRLPLAEEEWRWLGRWLAECLGRSVRVLRCSDPRAAGMVDGQPVAYHGTREFLAGVPAHAAKDGIEAVGGCGDWLSLAVRRLRGDEEPPEIPAAAAIDRGLRALATRLDAHGDGQGRTARWPDGHRCAVVLTHDVDAVDRWTPAHVRHLARHLGERWPREGIRSLARLPWAVARGMMPERIAGRRLVQCVALEKERDVHATYLFFSPEARYRTAYDGWYTPATVVDQTMTVGALWRDLVRDGFDIGLHLSIGAHDDAAAGGAEWAALRALIPEAETYRSHHLKHRAGVTERFAAAAGAGVELNIVATGFRRSSGLPFVFVDDGAPLYRVPTVIVDNQLEVHGARTDVQQHAWEQWRAILEETARNESLAVVLIHPENPGANAMVARVIDWARSAHAWMPTIRELMRHWHGRRRSSGVESLGC